VVFTNQKPTMTIHDHARFARTMADSEGTELEPHAVATGHPDAPEVLEIVREANAHVVFGENWHSDHSFMARTASWSILRCARILSHLACHRLLTPRTDTGTPCARKTARGPSGPRAVASAPTDTGVT